MGSCCWPRRTPAPQPPGRTDSRGRLCASGQAVGVFRFDVSAPRGRQKPRNTRYGAANSSGAGAQSRKLAQQSLEFAAVMRQAGSRPRSSRFRSASSRATRFLSRPALFRSLAYGRLHLQLLGIAPHCTTRTKTSGRESDEPDAPVLGEADVVIGGKQSNQANNAADYGLQQGGAEPSPQQATV